MSRCPAADLMAYHAATGAPGFLFAVIDMVRGFPTALREDVYLAMRSAGIPGRLIAAIAAFDYGSAVAIKIAPNRYTRPIPVTRGMLEGGSGSPGKFTVQCAGLARAVRDLGCGVTSPAGIISGLLHMDDLGQVVCDETDLRRALERVCSWLYEHGHEISPKKLVLAALAGAAGFRFTFDWQPSVEECADAARREAAKSPRARGDEDT